jgi:uracil-DNA glycosylase family 4
MDERRSKAWALLDIGPRWISRGPSRPIDPEPTADPTQPVPISWDTLRSQVLACERCALSETRQQVVFGVGPTPAPWMVIGEAPGEQEDRRGEPFVGPAGQLLDQMLQAIGVAREREVFIANVLKCRPPRNRDPAPDEIAQCTPWLAAQIEAVQPRVILAVGRFAAQTLLQTDAPIGRLRGMAHARPQGGAPVVATYHPSYLLRSPAEKAKAWQDLLLARQVFDAPG